MKRAFWIWTGLVAASMALAAYCFFFDSNRSPLHMLDMAIVQLVLIMMALKLTVPALTYLAYLASKKHDFTQEEVTSILAEAKRSGK